jgi:regulator-associated protein of mTOR
MANEKPTQYFREPQMKPNEPDEPGSADYNQRLWRRVRNEKIIGENQPLKRKAGTSRWDTSTALLNNGSQPMKMCFHQFEDHLAVSDDRDTVWYFHRASN